MVSPKLPAGACNPCGILDKRDSAQAIKKGVTADYAGSHPLYVNDPVNCHGLDSDALATLFFPEVTTWKKQLKGPEALVSITRAQTQINFPPKFPAFEGS